MTPPQQLQRYGALTAGSNSPFLPGGAAVVARSKCSAAESFDELL